jgi:hypothetical protein
LTHIKETLSTIRAERFPAVPQELVEAILEAEADHQELSQRRLGRAKVRAAIEAALAE